MLLRSNKISGTGAKCKEVINGFLFYCVVLENIHAPPPLWIFQNRPPKFTPLPSGISKIFAHPREMLLSLIEVNKEVVLFTRMPNFVSFMYFLLNCITDKRIPYALKSQTNFVRFM